MNRVFLILSCLLVHSLISSCSKEDAEQNDIESKRYSLELSVSSRGGEAETGLDDIKERSINSIYVFAYDDNYITSPDYMKDAKVKDGDNGTYQLKMPMRDKGKKRFYIFINPTENIKQVLDDPKSTEDRLKSLTIDMNKPLNGPSLTNMPMSNCFEAYVDGMSNDNHTNSKADEVFLYPDLLRKDNKITEIPVFRSLGKITVQAYLKKGNNRMDYVGQALTNQLSIKELSIFNFNADGSALPIWELNHNELNYWVLSGNASNDNYEWNKNLKLDLTTMSKREELIVNNITSLNIDNKNPISSSDRNNPDKITHFYLCQNSFGEKILDTEQEGVKDVDGNRTTKMIVALNDGRVSEIPLPYLRRNDNLKVRLAINEFKIDADFEIWKQSTVTPDWSEEISPNPIN